MAQSIEQFARELLQRANITVDGDKLHDIQVHDSRLYNRVIREGDLGLGEAYMDGWWDAASVDQFIARVISGKLDQHIKVSPSLVWSLVSAKLFNEQTVRRASKDVSYHYNIGNDLYEKMLDKRMIYSCGYWRDARNIDEAQEAKLDLICRKLKLKKGMSVLDIGCGWGGFAKFAATKYGVKVTGITLSDEQLTYARTHNAHKNIEYRKQDYRELTGTYDRIVSIGMLEHVGIKNYKEFFAICDGHLAPRGLMLHHAIGNNYEYTPNGSRWLRKYIFPGNELPTLGDYNQAIEGKFLVEDVHNFGPDYDKTLLAWQQAFEKAYPTLDHSVYDERFYRMWNYYLLSIAAAFRTRSVQLYQIVMRRIETSDTYDSVR